MRNPKKYEQIERIRNGILENAATFVATKKTKTKRFRTTQEMSDWLDSTYPNGKITAYIESLIYADHRRRNIDIYKKDAPIHIMTEEEIGDINAKHWNGQRFVRKDEL